MCSTKFCKNDSGNKSYCSTCRSKQSREKNFTAYSYNTLKANAKRRGKDFQLTLEEFKKFCVETNYLVGKGRSKTSLSIDRVENSIGYVLSNLKILTVSDNARKGAKVLEYDYVTRQATVIDCRTQKSNDDYF